jgi:hypothetical protein
MPVQAVSLLVPFPLGYASCSTSYLTTSTISPSTQGDAPFAYVLAFPRRYILSSRNEPDLIIQSNTPTSPPETFPTPSRSSLAYPMSNRSTLPLSRISPIHTNSQPPNSQDNSAAQMPVPPPSDTSEPSCVPCGSISNGLFNAYHDTMVLLPRLRLKWYASRRVSITRRASGHWSTPPSTALVRTEPTGHEMPS